MAQRSTRWFSAMTAAALVMALPTPAFAAAASDAGHHHPDADVRKQNMAFYEYLVPIVKGWSLRHFMSGIAGRLACAMPSQVRRCMNGMGALLYKLERWSASFCRIV